MNTEDFWDAVDHTTKAAYVDTRLIKLAKTELLVLAKHYRIPYAEAFLEGSTPAIRRSGKRELCFEVAEHMLVDGRI